MPGDWASPGEAGAGLAASPATAPELELELELPELLVLLVLSSLPLLLPSLQRGEHGERARGKGGVTRAGRGDSGLVRRLSSRAAVSAVAGPLPR